MSDELFDLSGKVAFIPGGYGGIGSALAAGLAARGACVAVAGRNAERAHAVAEQLSARGAAAMGLQMDAGDIQQVRAAVERVAERFGSVDILVNCVGTQIEQPMLDVTEAAFDSVYAANLKAAM